ncbi:hypothetical protein [Paenibacillus sp. MSJ-34]|nr:hypothetical protein [Paenibacillus sp. MSJ-34]MBU5445632.1 hypothetical protein [Paenibacillus sp. MSJ-34]
MLYTINLLLHNAYRIVRFSPKADMLSLRYSNRFGGLSCLFYFGGDIL